MRFTKAFTQQRPIWILLEMVLALAVIGTIDIFTGYQIRLLPFYCGPIFVVAWFCERRLSIVIGLIAGVISLTADWIDRDPDLFGWTQPWEIFRHIVSCLAVALVGSALRAKSDIAAARIALLERSQRLEREIVNISETEQRRIGQDLHDGLCQYLAALGCSAGSLRDDLRKLSLPSEAHRAGDLANLLRDAVVQTRDLAHGLAPAHVSQVGLPLALQSLAESVTRLQEVNCTFECEGDDAQCDESTATHLFRIAQEAINNATRHGRARNLAIRLEAFDNHLTLSIRDDGVGIANSNSSGMGLAVMRYRARLSGGELMIQRPPGGGTLISCTARPNQALASSNEIPIA
jgi:signal transduction histidine kinase